MSKFCRHCGKKLKRGAIKCPRCGENVLDYDQKEASGSEKNGRGITHRGKWRKSQQLHGATAVKTYGEVLCSW